MEEEMFFIFLQLYLQRLEQKVLQLTKLWELNAEHRI